MRLLVVFVGVVVAAEHLEFAPVVFLSAFLIVIGGLVLAASIAAGIGLHAAVQRRVERIPDAEERSDRSVWHHV